MTVRTRLLWGFAAVAVLLLIPTLFAASRLSQLRHLAVEGRSGQAAAVSDLGHLQAHLSDLDRLERSLLATSDTVLGQAVLAAVDSLDFHYERLSASPYGDQARLLARHLDEIAGLATVIAELVAAGRLVEATTEFDSMVAAFARMEDRTSEVAESIDRMAGEDFTRAERLSRAARAQTLAFLLFAILAAVAVVLWTTEALTRPLSKLRRATARVADGAFETPADLPYDRHDEIGELSRSFKRMTTRLERLDRTKAEFLGMASHELKTPLNVISAYAELIEDSLRDEADERQLGMIAAVSDQAEIMGRRVSRLMDISRLEAGTYELAPEAIRVEDLMTGVRRMFEDMAVEEGVELAVHIDESTPDEVVIDIDVVRDEVLGNLVSNALRFTPAGGRIDLEVEGREGGFQVTVTDSGSGVPDEHREFIFEKHYTSDRTRAMGSGLGLAIAKEMVELHGGLISLDSAPTGGARFRVALPLTPATPELEVPGYLVRGRDAGADETDGHETDRLAARAGRGDRMVHSHLPWSDHGPSTSAPRFRRLRRPMHVD